MSSKIVWYIFFTFIGLFLLYLCTGVAHEYTKYLKGWRKTIGFILALIFVAIIFFLFSGNVPELGR